MTRAQPARRVVCTPGFTLVEVVVSLTLLSLIMLATVSALRTFGNTQVSLDRLTNRIDEMRAVSGFLRDTLQAAVPGEEGGGGLSLGGPTADPPFFQGDADAFAWKAPVLFGEGFGGVFLVRVVREEGRLLLQWQEPVRYRKEISWLDAQQRELLQGVEEFVLSYRAEFDQPWQPVWNEKGTPALVRVGIRANGRYWPDLIIAVQR